MLVYIMIFVSRFGRVARGMWWLAIGRCYIGALCSCLFNNVVFLSNFLTLTPSENGFAEQLAVEWPPAMLNPGYATVAHDDANTYKGDIQPHLFTGFSFFFSNRQQCVRVGDINLSRQCLLATQVRLRVLGPFLYTLCH